MEPLDLLIWHYIPGAIFAALCFLLVRAIVRRLLDRNELRENQQMAENINAMREWQVIQAPVQYALDEWMRAGEHGTPGYRCAADKYERAEAERDRRLIEWRHKWRQRGVQV